MRASDNFIGPSDLSASPTFNAYSSSSHLVDVADRVIREFADDQDHFPYCSDDDNENDGVFFSSVPPSPCNATLCRYYLAEDDDGNIHQQHQPQDSDKKGFSEPGNKISHIEEPEQTQQKGVDDDDDDDDDTEFEFATPLTEDTSSPIAADEIFHNGQIRPLFPLFNTDLIFANTDWRLPRQKPSATTNHLSFQSTSSPNSTNSAPTNVPIRVPLKKLLITERETDPSSSSSETDDLDGLAPDTYCVWTPNHRPEEMNKKSNSTGSSSKRWRLRRLLNRTHSDGSRESFMFLPAHQTRDQKERSKDQKQRCHFDSNKLVRVLLPPVTAKNYEVKSKGKGKGIEVGGYGENNRPARDHQTPDRRKTSYLPYRQDLVGFFANASGVTRTIQPF